MAPNDYRIAYNFMVVLMKHLNFIDALRIAQDIDVLDELEPELSLQIGTCHLALKNYYEAVEHLLLAPQCFQHPVQSENLDLGSDLDGPGRLDL